MCYCFSSVLEICSRICLTLWAQAALSVPIGVIPVSKLILLDLVYLSVVPIGSYSIVVLIPLPQGPKVWCPSQVSHPTSVFLSGSCPS
jgi:hypothetical protein